MSKNSAFDAHVQVCDSTIDLPMSFHSELYQAGKTAQRYTDIITIGSENTLFRTVQRAFRGPKWTVAHAGSVNRAEAYLRSNVAAVAITVSHVAGADWREIIAQLNALPDPPELIVAAHDRSIYSKVVKLGGYDVIEHPVEKADLLWTVASAWHHWMKKRGRTRPGGELCSDA